MMPRESPSPGPLGEIQEEVETSSHLKSSLKMSRGLTVIDEEKTSKKVKIDIGVDLDELSDISSRN